MNHVGDHHQLGTALQKQGDLEGAITEYRTVLRLDSDHLDAHYNLGIQLKTCRSLSFSHPNVLKRVWELPISGTKTVIRIPCPRGSVGREHGRVDHSMTSDDRCNVMTRYDARNPAGQMNRGSYDLSFQLMR